MKVKVLVAQLALRFGINGLYPPGSSVHGILQAGVLEWVAIPFYREILKPGIKHGSPELQADSLSSEPLGKPFLEFLEFC